MTKRRSGRGFWPGAKKNAPGRAAECWLERTTHASVAVTVCPSRSSPRRRDKQWARPPTKGQLPSPLAWRNFWQYENHTPSHRRRPCFDTSALRTHSLTSPCRLGGATELRALATARALEAAGLGHAEAPKMPLPSGRPPALKGNRNGQCGIGIDRQ